MRALLLALALAGPAWGQQAPDALASWEADREAPIPGGGVALADFLYAARPLVIFAESPLQPQLAEALRLIADDADALARRDVAVIVDSDPGADSALRRELRPRGFGLVLVDKDGRVVLRRPTPLTVRELVQAIDRTSIRRDELRLAGEGNTPGSGCRGPRRAPAAGLSSSPGPAG